MRPLINGMQRILATILVGALYVLPAAMGGLVDQIEAELDTVEAPERAAAFIMSLPAVAKGVLEENELADESKEPSPQPPPEDLLSSTNGTPIASTKSRAISASNSGRKSGRKSTKRSNKRNRQQCMASSGQVSQLDSNHYRVERTLLDYYFGDTEAAAKLGSANWHRDSDGDIDGIRLRRVRCGSPIEEAGLRKGDIIREANGKDVDSLAGVLSLWWQLRRKDTVRLTITRDGQRKRIRYSLV